MRWFEEPGTIVLVEGVRLMDRPVAPDDLAFVGQVWNDERVAPTIGGTLTELQLRERLAHWERHWSDHGFGMTMFRDRLSGDRVGWGGLQYSVIGIGQRLTVGYVIAPDLWGRGYATEIASSSIDYALGVLGVAEVYASVAAANGASRRVLEKVGMSLHCEIDHAVAVELVFVKAR